MPRIVRKVQPGGSPGVLVAPAERKVERVVIRVVCFGPDHLEETEVESIEEALLMVDRLGDQAGVVWIDIVGLHDLAILEELGRRFSLHPLVLEDVLNVGQRPKVELYEDHVFVIMRQVHFTEALNVEQISLVFGERVVVTFQEQHNDPFEPVRERIRRQDGGRIRNAGASYLAYALIDALVDNLYPVLERYGEWIESLEQEILEDPGPEMLASIQSIKRDCLWMRRVAWPHREVVNGLVRAETPLIDQELKAFLRDCYDHTVQIMDVVDTFRDLAGGLTDLYLSSAGNRMNEVMKVLTIMASIFIPLTFIAGIYGMNFDSEASRWNMPELSWVWGYPVALGAMAAIALVMYLFFKRKGWL